MSKTKRMRPPSEEARRQADEQRRHNELMKRLDQLKAAVHENSVMIVAAAIMSDMPPGMKPKARADLMRRTLIEAWVVMNDFDIPPHTDEFPRGDETS